MIADSILTVKRGELSRAEWEKLLRTLTFVDNDEREVQAYDYVDGRDVVRMPRGVWSLLPEHVQVTDLRSRPLMPKVRLAITLDAGDFTGQKDAVMAMFKHQQGQVICPPGAGKTEIGLAFAASSRTRTLVIVHTRDLFVQWTKRAAKSTPGFKVGQIAGKKNEVGHLTIAMAQTLRRQVARADKKWWRQFGCVIVDEAHHAAAETWEWVLNYSPAYYRFGLTATDKRADGREPLVNFNIGPPIYRIKFVSQVPLTVRPVETRFISKYGGGMWSRMMRELVNDVERNKRIADVAWREARRGNSVLILSRQIKHLENIYAAFPPDATGVAMLTGRISMSERNKRIQMLRDGSLNIVLATQLADEGLDVPRLNRILLTYPGKHEGRIVQQVGREIRKFPGKVDAIVYDFVDEHVPTLARQYDERRSAYKSMGIKTGKVVRYDKGKERQVEKKSGWELLRSLSVRRSRSGSSQIGA